MGGITGIVLAAGASRRMGRDKALLEDGAGRTFLERAISALRGGGCGDVVAVVRDAAAPRSVAAEAGARAVVNPRPESEQVESLRLGLEAAGDAAAVVVLPVDHPLVGVGTVAALVARHAERPESILRPVHGDRPGHPTLFPRAVWRSLLRADLPQGARSVVEGGAHETLDVEVDDAMILADIDTPAAYARWVSPP